MKKFVKKLSFVMATAMVVTSLNAPANAEAASKNFVRVKGSRKAVTSKAVYVGGRKVNFDYTVGKKTTGVKGSWMSSDTSVAAVDKKTGVVTAVGNGKAVITFKTKKTKKMKKVYTMKVTVYGRTRAESVTVETPTDASVKVGKTAEFMAKLNLSEKIKAAGGKESTYMVFAESDTTAASVKVDGMKIMVEGKEAHATPATIKVYAAQATTLEKAKASKYQAKMAEFKVAVKADFEAKQTAANKIKVMGNDLSTNPAVYVVKNDKDAPLTIKTVTLNTEKTEAMLESVVGEIPAGKYTLTHNAKETATFDVEKVKVSKIKLMPEDKAILMGNTGDGLKKAYVHYAVYDQFENDITKTNLPKVFVSGSFVKNTSEKGKVMFESEQAFVPNISKVNVSIVDVNTGINVSQVLTVSNEALLWKAEYKGLYNFKTKKFVENIEETAELKDFGLLFTAKDQYDTVMEKTGSSDSINVLLVTTTGLKATNKNTDDIKEVEGKKYIKFGLDRISNDFEVVSGVVNVQGIVKNNGSTVNGKFEVIPSAKVDTITVSEGTNGVYEGQENELAFTAIGLDGKAITEFKLLKMFNDVKYMANYKENVLWFKEGKDGKAMLMYKPTVSGLTGTNSTVTPLTFRTKTNKFSTAMINVKAKRMPVGIMGLKKDVATGVTRTHDIVIKASQVDFKDQYGNAMTYKEIEELKTGTSPKVIAKFATTTGTSEQFEMQTGNNAVQLTGMDIELVKIKAKANDNSNVKANESYTVMVNFGIEDSGKIKAGTETTFKASNVRLDDVQDIVMDEIKTQPTPDLYTTNLYDVVPAIHGMYDGSKINLVKGDDFVIIGGVDNAGNTTKADFVNVPLSATITSRVNPTAKAKAIVQVLTSTPKTLEKEYTYTNVLRHVAEVKVKDDKTAIEKIDIASNSTNVTYTDIAKTLELKDQYGRTIADGDAVMNTVDKFTFKPSLVFSGFDSSVITVEKNGTPDAQFKISGGEANKEYTFKVKIFFPISGKTLEKDIKVKRVA